MSAVEKHRYIHSRISVTNAVTKRVSVPLVKTARQAKKKKIMGRDHTWGSWTTYKCPYCDRRGLKGRGGQRAHICLKHPKEYYVLWMKELGLCPDQSREEAGHGD